MHKHSTRCTFLPPDKTVEWGATVTGTEEVNCFTNSTALEHFPGNSRPMPTTPPPPSCGVHYLWFAFVCFLIRSHPPPVQAMVYA